MQSGVFHPGFEFKQQSNEYINVVHILAIHGWSVMDRLDIHAFNQKFKFAYKFTLLLQQHSTGSLHTICRFWFDLNKDSLHGHHPILINFF